MTITSVSQLAHIRTMKKFCSPYERTNSCLKSALFLYNLLLWFLGMFLVAVGLYLFLQQNEFSGITRFFFLLPAVFVLASGFSILCVGLLAICGILGHDKLFLTAFSFITLVISCVLFAAAAFGLSLIIGEDLGVENRAISSLHYYTQCNKTEGAWDSLQRRFNCCGVSGPEDWGVLSPSLGYVPHSCCKEQENNCGLVQSGEIEVFQEGCLSSLIEYEHRQLAISTGVCLVSAMFTSLGCLLSFMLIINFSTKSIEE